VRLGAPPAQEPDVAARSAARTRREQDASLFVPSTAEQRRRMGVEHLDRRSQHDGVHRLVMKPIIPLAAAFLSLACSAPSRSAVTQSTPATAATTPSAVPPSTPASRPVASSSPSGPPPATGTVQWYVNHLPHFGPPPSPAAVPRLRTTGSAQQFYQIPVGGQRVAFITIDDGWIKDPDMVTLLRAAHVPFTMFLTTNAIKNNPTFFRTLQGLGGTIEDHTVTHPHLTSDTYSEQRHEICDNRATLTHLYQRAPILMRAPYGQYNSTTLAAAGSCGIRANVFWNEYAITGTLTWQRPGGIHPGDMVLMHFDQYFKQNLLATLQAFHRQGITPALLESYLIAGPAQPVPTAAAAPAALPPVLPFADVARRRRPRSHGRGQRRA
jgi:peptidoglycan/xylan/chitin deacetylase (PgdA/CDA1 family)